MRILLVCDSLSNGGAERQMALLATALPAVHERLVCSIDDGPFAGVLRQQGVELVSLGRKGRIDPSPVLRLARLIFAYRPDVVHCWGWMSTLAAVPPCRLLRIPLIDGTIRSGGVLSHRSGVYWWTARLADQVVANSRSGLAAHPVPRRKGRVIHNGFDTTRIPSRVAAARLPEERFGVVMASRMASEKDFDTFLSAARHLHDQDLNSGRWIFFAVGDGVERARLMEQHEDLMRAGVLQFVQPGMNVMGTLCTAQVGVLLTDPRMAVEGCSNSILEYMACGLPVICSRGGGNAEVVVEGKTGFIIPPRDWASLVDRLRYLESHRERSTEMGAEGRLRVARLFSTERLARETLKLYWEVVINADRGSAFGRPTSAAGAQ